MSLGEKFPRPGLQTHEVSLICDLLGSWTKADLSIPSANKYWLSLSSLLTSFLTTLLVLFTRNIILGERALNGASIIQSVA
jgi:hypothetical protein